MEKSNVTIRKHYATEKIPFSEVSSRFCWQSVPTHTRADRQKETNAACVNSSSTEICPLHWSVFLHLSLCFVLVPSTNYFFTVLPASHERTHILTHTHPNNKAALRVRGPQYIFCRLGSTASFKKEKTRRMPDRFPLLPLVK